LGQANFPKKEKKAKKPFNWHVLKALFIVFTMQGIVRKTRWSFWFYLFQMIRHNSGGVISYLTICAQSEHFLEYRQLVKDNIEAQLAAYLEQERQLKAIADEDKDTNVKTSAETLKKETEVAA
ncbi:MAG: DUF4070 domain-containing protein, partial [Merismopedia sp. SIO2A8]|nr:DUF4070 domain-containing protein [Merismopedia sp. SIO2A8]